MPTFGIDRPYPPLQLTTAGWQAVAQIIEIQLDVLRFTQRGVWLEALLTAPPPVSGDPLPHVVLWQGTYYLEDGHTRVARALLQGIRSLRCRLVEIR